MSSSWTNPCENHTDAVVAAARAMWGDARRWAAPRAMEPRSTERLVRWAIIVSSPARRDEPTLWGLWVQRRARPVKGGLVGRSLGFIVFVLAVAGCAAQGPYRRGEEATERFVADPALCPELKASSSFRIPVAYVEIDEQGAFQDRSQVERALALVGEGTKPKYVVVFVHGWFHNAKGDDPNVQRFKCALNNLQSIDDNAGEEIIGVYVGWRGESWSSPLVRYATFWDRKNTSDEVGRGSLVEFLMRLEGSVKPTPDTTNKLMIVGHSFGASVVFNSIGQILLARFILDAERLASSKPTPTHAQSKPGLVSGYGDLVVLMNPAIEATRIMPF